MLVLYTMNCLSGLMDISLSDSPTMYNLWLVLSGIWYVYAIVCLFWVPSILIVVPALHLDEGYCALVYTIFFLSFFILPGFYLYHHISGMIPRLEFMEWTSLLCWSALVTVLAVVAGASLALGSSIGSQKRMPWNGSRSNMKVWFLTSPRILRPGRFLGRCHKFWARLMLCRPKILYYYPCFLSIGRACDMFSGPKSVNLFVLSIFLAALINYCDSFRQLIMVHDVVLGFHAFSMCLHCTCGPWRMILLWLTWLKRMEHVKKKALVVSPLILNWNTKA